MRSVPPESVQTEPLVVSRHEAVPLGVLLERAELELEAGNGKRAAVLFRQAFDAEPKGAFAPQALLGEARARLLAEEPTIALERLKLLVKRFAQSPLRPRAQLLLALTLLQLERYPEAADAARSLATPPRTATLLEQVVVDATGALALLDERGPDDEVGAERLLQHSRALVEERRLDQAGTFPVELAALYFAAGEFDGRRAAKRVFEPFPPNFGDELERRCELILESQAAYSAVMRAKDPRFAAMAGLRIAELYESLHRDLMRVPRPKSDPLKQQLFEGALRLRFSLLLSKARIMLTHTLAMANRTALKSTWVTRANAALQRIDEQKRVESEALERLPFTREQLQAKLDEILAEREASGVAKSLPGKSAPAEKRPAPAGASPPPAPR